MSKNSGLVCLLLVARYHRLDADEARLKHEFDLSGKGLDGIGLVQAARHIGFKARLAK